MESLLENQRSAHEERERITDSITKEFLAEKRTHKARINSDQRVKKLLERYEKLTEELEVAYKDENNGRSAELEAIAGPNEFAEFYSRLKSLKDAHRKNPDEVASPLSMEYQHMNEILEDPDRVEQELVRFTDEEGYGRFLDLHVLYDAYINLKGIKRVDYLQFLSILERFVDIPKDAKKTGAYKNYLTQLEDYLKAFIARTKPLLDLDGTLQQADSDSARLFVQGGLPGWAKPQSANDGTSIDLSQFASSSDLEALGLERLKNALLALGLKCGGTLKDRAERLFATKGHSLSEMEKKALRSDMDKENAKNEGLAKSEERIKKMVEILGEEREATKENTERKQARAVGEGEEEEEEIEEIPSDEEVDDSVPYNPKNLPLGWDGKPIPYWLYKLHGLNISYSCEICGNQTYKGPKAFQRHFTEWRHSHGMRCLGIPNTPHFANITKIADAVELWQKMKSEKERHKWDADVHEEYEDSAGNVVNKRTYEDLKRQGLL
ncbi:hypothetical protein PMAYCL1PPCAC_06787 [Pristionchus mayeri]|uniref:Matrin-type domain-containing protein n=1 Tax=Pristionchus mayeri TaxID=1317129 RepID=A0AAN4Z8R4_9BILA|nr:hypothetical protein PMAYCL1PPCAC_06787 [Pristionchus mayeri]